MKENEAKTQNKPQSKGTSVLMKIVNTVINIMIVLVLIVSLLIAVMAISSKANGISTIFGYTIQPIQSDSMKGGSPDGYPEGDFEHGDLMIAKATNFDYKAEYQLGDIVTFVTKDSDNKDMLIVHRIVDIVKNDDGDLTYQTQGDNRETSPVPDQQEPAKYLKSWEIGSVYYTNGYTGKILKGWGVPLDFLQTQKGFFFVVLLPMILFFLYEMIRVIMNAMNYKKAKADEEKDEAVKAAVAQALAGQNDQKENAVESPENMTPEQMEQFKQFLAMQKAQQEAADSTEQANAEEETEGSDNSEE